MLYKTDGLRFPPCRRPGKRPVQSKEKLLIVKQKQFSPRINTNLDRGEHFVFKVNGKPVQAYPGETIAAALIAAGWRLFRKTGKSNHPRGFYCGMGVCWECTMIVDGRPNVRTCTTLAQPGMHVEIQTGLDPDEEG